MAFRGRRALTPLAAHGCRVCSINRRHLHAKYVKRTHSIIAPEAWTFALPAKGLLLKPLLPALWELGGLERTIPAASLVR